MVKNRGKNEMKNAKLELSAIESEHIPQLYSIELNGKYITSAAGFKDRENTLKILRKGIAIGIQSQKSKK